MSLYLSAAHLPDKAPGFVGVNAVILVRQRPIQAQLHAIRLLTVRQQERVVLTRVPDVNIDLLLKPICNPRVRGQGAVVLELNRDLSAGAVSALIRERRFLDLLQPLNFELPLVLLRKPRFLLHFDAAPRALDFVVNKEEIIPSVAA